MRSLCYHSAVLFGILLVVPVFVFAAQSFEGAIDDTTQVNVTVTCPGGVCLVSGCTDPKATNYSAAANYDDGSCTYPPVIVNISGCTDPAAINFNANATVDSGTCRYTVPNVSNFTAAAASNGIRLTWVKPIFNRLASIIIVRGTRLPASVADGELIYEGTGSSFVDTSAVPGTRYYYLAVVQSIEGAYSSGAVANFRLGNNEPPPVLPPPPPDLPLVPGGGPGGSGGGYSGGAFGNLPSGSIATATKEQLRKRPSLFVLFQPGEKIKPFWDGSFVKIRGNKNFTISVDYYKVPEVLKTIGVTLTQAGTERSFSFLLALNKEGTAYEATIGALPEDGIYETAIYLINYADQTVWRVNGQIAVVGSLGFLGVGTEKFVREVAGPVAVTGGALAGILQLLLSGGKTISELYLLILRQLGAVLGFFGIKKKNQPWGTVYDSVTKRPIDPAYVSVFSGSEEIATAITDIDGRYGFSLLDGLYRLSAAKTHYRFPSALLAGQTQDVMYGNLYFGEPFHAGPGEVINKNIPLDPVDFDWNEFVKQQGKFSELFKRQELTRAKVSKAVYRIGFAASALYLVFWPGIFNLAVMALYLGLFIAGHYFRQRHKTVVVRNKATLEPIPFAIIHVYYAELGQEVKKVVTDMIGRFYLLLRPGAYYLAIDHKQPDGSYARIYESTPKMLPKGVWNEDILI